MRLPGVIQREQVTVEPYEGSGAYGDVYGTPQPLRCRRDDTRRLVRDVDGHEVVSEATLWCAPDVQVGPEDRVTMPDGRITRVLSVKTHPGLGQPSQREVVLA